MGVKIKDTPLSYYVEMLRECKPFAFVRYGNGEWDAIFKTAIITGSHSQHLTVAGLHEAMERSVREAPRDERYMLGMQSQSYLASRGLWRMVVQYLGSCGDGLVWHNGDVLHKASMKGKLFPLVSVLKQRNVIFVGPAYAAKVNRYIKVERHLKVRSRDCYVQLPGIQQAILKGPRGRVIVFSAGPMAKVLIHQLYPLIGDTDTLLDCGSLWDPYVGRNTRRYHKRIKGQILRSNLFGV